MFSVTFQTLKMMPGTTHETLNYSLYDNHEIPIISSISKFRQNAQVQKRSKLNRRIRKRKNELSILTFWIHESLTFLQPEPLAPENEDKNLLSNSFCNVLEHLPPPAIMEASPNF